MSNIACIDSNIIIWGIRNSATPGQEQNIDRAQYLFEKLQSDDTRIIIPSVVFGEILVQANKNNVVQLSLIMQERFEITPFDAISANEYGRLYNKLKQKKTTKTKYKIDIMILATALSKNAKTLYTDDRWLLENASAFIETRGLPDLPQQQGSLLEIA